MFVAWRDLRYAKGRFALIGAVVALISVLVGFLSGLTAGLANENISAITGLQAQMIAFSDPSSDSSPSYPDSAVTEAQAATWAAQPGVSAVQPLGISQLRVYTPSAQTSIAVFGSPAGSASSVPTAAGGVTLPRTAADALDVAAGGTVTLGGMPYLVAKVLPDTWYSHTPVAWVQLGDWQKIAATTGNTGAFATVLTISGTSIDTATADSAAQTVSTPLLLSLTALAGFRSEIGSLLLMVAMLFGISALVVGAFFTVWGMQRQPDVAILKALGGSNRMLLTDSLGQAAVILLLGVGVGISLTALFGLALGSALPFILSPLTTALPGVIMITMGLAGAAFALRSVTHADPLTALGGNR